MKRAGKLFSMIFVLLAVVLALLIVGVRLLGVLPYAVLSGSMSPNYPVGSLIYVKPAVFQDVHVGDPITFHLDGESVVATHRVIQIDEANKLFYTKGDANEAQDGAPVAERNLIGVPVFCIPVLGYVASFVSAPPGLYITISAVAIYLLLSSLPALLKKADKKDASAHVKQEAEPRKPVNISAKVKG